VDPDRLFVVAPKRVVFNVDRQRITIREVLTPRRS
jgi:hypothetical protein